MSTATLPAAPKATDRKAALGVMCAGTTAVNGVWLTGLQSIPLIKLLH